MSQPKNPPSPTSDPKTRVHHAPSTPGISPPPGTPSPGQNVEDTVSVQDYSNPGITDYMNTGMPPNLTYDGDQPVAASQEPPPLPAPTVSSDQAARKAGDDIYVGLTKNQVGFWPAVSQAARHGYVLDRIDPGALKADLPFNSQQVTDGAVSVIKAIQRDKKAACMEVDAAALGADVALYLRIQRAQEEVNPIKETLDANAAAVLKRIADRVQEGLKRGASVIASDGRLDRMLEPAKAIRGEPASTALATKAEKARTEQAIRKDEQTKAQSNTPQAPPKAVTTVSTAVDVPASPTKK